MRPDAQDHPSRLSQRGRLRLLPAALHRHDGLSCSRAPREELGEDSDNEGTESEAEGASPRGPHGQGCAKAQGQGQGRAKTPHRLVRPAGRDQAGRPSHLRLRVFCKSGEKCLQMSWGPLRFVDSLASMIDGPARTSSCRSSSR